MATRPGSSELRMLALGTAAASAVAMVDPVAFSGGFKPAFRQPSPTLGDALRIQQHSTFASSKSSSCRALAPVTLLAALSLLVRRPSGSRVLSRRGITARRFFGGNKETEVVTDEDDDVLSDAAITNIAKLEGQIAEFKELAEEKQAAHERLKSESNNFRARTRNELAAARGKAAIPLVKELLPIVDEFELASKNLKCETDGQKAIQAQFSALFDKMLGLWLQLGVEKLKAVGEEFNPELHEAVTMIPSEEYKADLVCNELRAGWGIKAGDNLQVLRPSLVCVSAGPGPS
ncbi:unnamed protein product [Polarella glacialis]|uniref:GrpE protein homolog n=3 Tax=Polarella glacialis TaxID=89957 RepID=A0A813KHE7_POLGL|nr:unnamed protein product [Polarella glacialis]